MEKKTFKVPNIGCNGCINAVQGELRDLEGVKSAVAELETKMVTVEYDAPASWNDIVKALTEIDYAPEST
jgi:copper chaperone CopZ